MKEDLDRYMEESGIDGLLVIGAAAHNANMTYFTGPSHIGWGVLVRRRQAPPVLYCNDMERDEVTRSGLRFAKFDAAAYSEEAGNDPRDIRAVGLERILRENDLIGRIQVCGRADVAESLDTFHRLETRLPGLEVVSFDGSTSPLLRARATKGQDEIDRIRRMGAVTVEVAGLVADFLTSLEIRSGLLRDRRGDPLTIGDVKRRIDLWLVERGAENPEGTIFAVGHDAGVPHSTGVDHQPIPVGVPIVFDLFPCERGGGYFYDFTRTWCLGHATDDVAQVHGEVLQAYQLAVERTRPGVETRSIQLAVCEAFEARGHPSVLSSPNTRQGYVHSVGHGLGLDVHEAPFFRLPPGPPVVLQPGHVVTIEPGLYYPERGLGVRLEDTLRIDRDGARVMAPYPMDLVLPTRRSQRGQASKVSRTKKAKPRTVRRAARDG